MKLRRKIAQGKTDMYDVQRLRQVMDLRAKGLLFREIGQQLGVGAKYASALHRIAVLRGQLGKLGPA